MLIPSSPSIWKTLAATPGWLRMPAPTIETLPICSSVRIALADVERLERLDARVLQVVAGDREREVGACSSGTGSFWMIMSTLTFASASAPKIAPGDAGLVADAGEGHARLLGGVGDGCDQGSFHRLVLGDDEGTGAVLERAAAVDADAVVARVLDRAQLQHPGARGRHLEHLLEGDDGQLARVGDDPRVGAEDAGDVGVDLADRGAERGGERDRGRVGAAAAERGHVAARSPETPWKPATRTIRSSVERVADAVGADVEDPRLGVRGVGDDPRLRAGQRDRLVAHVVDRHRAERAGDPLADREQHVHLARLGAVGDLLRHRDQLVGRLAARREHGDDAAAALARGDDPRRRRA